jgi:hypothetical protein
MIIFATHGINNREQSRFDKTHGFPAIFAVGIPTVEGFDAIRVKEHSGSILKTDMMLAQIERGFVGVSLEIHRFNVLRL